jgi:hypothetical protein
MHVLCTLNFIAFLCLALQQFIAKVRENEYTVAEKPALFTLNQTSVPRNKTHYLSQIRMSADKTHSESDKCFKIQVIHTGISVIRHKS